MYLKKSNLDQLVNTIVTKRYVYEAVFCVSSVDDKIDQISAAGNIKEDGQYYIASINKLFVSAIILKLYKYNKLDLTDKISKYLPEEIVRGLHVHKHKDYSDELSLAHLMSHTSGLPCYLIDKQTGGKKAMPKNSCNL